MYKLARSQKCFVEQKQSIPKSYLQFTAIYIYIFKVHTKTILNVIHILQTVRILQRNRTIRMDRQ